MNQSGSKSLDIVLPCYRPGKDWATHVIRSYDSICRLLPEISIQIILVNDGSASFLKEEDVITIRSAIPQFNYISYDRNRGKGFALRTGVEATRAPLVIYTDVDFPYEEESLAKLYRQLESGQADIVPGIRDSEYYKGVPKGRMRISKFLRWMLRNFLRLKVTDTQCGLKGFNEKGKTLFLQTRIKRFLFDLEFIFMASNDTSIRLSPCEVRLKPHVVFSPVNWRILFREGINFAWVFLKAMKRKFFGR